MAIQKWQPSTLYLPGAVVVPTSAPGAVPTAIPNSDFDAGDSDWTKGAGWAINTNVAFSGTYSAEYSGPGQGELISEHKHPVSPGKAITATCFVHQGASDDDQASAAVLLRWYDGSDAFISDSVGNSVSTGEVGNWLKSTVSAVAPPNAAKVSIGCLSYNDWAAINVDNFAWNYVTGAAAVGLTFTAVGQSSSGAIQANCSFSTGGSFTMPAATFTAVNAYGVGSSVSGTQIEPDYYRMPDTGISPNDSVVITGSTLNDGTYKVNGSISQFAFKTKETLINEGPVGVSVTYSGNKIVSSTNFEDQGVIVGASITISGSASNDGVYTVTDVYGSVVHVAESITPEPSVSVSIALDGAPIGTGEAGGMSGTTEPLWPTTLGVTVQDNEVLWEASETDSVTWEASSILTSGQTEPSWPTSASSFVSDNNIAWETVPLRIEDENCPHTKVVAIAASKVFAGDTDIVRFCATLNARDWSSEDDAGFLPTGLQQKSQVGVDAMGVYRGNLAVWSASTFQVWQVDPDPSVMALLDAMEGIGSIHQQAVQPVSDDLFFLAALGVRTVSIAEGANNLAAGDVGIPIDDLIQAEANQPDVEPVASYYPSAGQYWLAFRPLTIAAGLLAGQFLLTSTMYPISVEDSIASASNAHRAWNQGIYTVDEVENTSTPVSGLLQQVLKDAEMETDAITNTSTPDLGLLGSELKKGYFEDAVTNSSDPDSGTIVAALIEYRGEDAVTNSSEPDSGTLT